MIVIVIVIDSLEYRSEPVLIQEASPYPESGPPERGISRWGAPIGARFVRIWMRR